MLKPPFTILILKDSHRPVTINVTSSMIFLFFGAIPLITAALGFWISMTFMNAEKKSDAGSESGYTSGLIETKSEFETVSPGAGINNVKISMDDKGAFGIEMVFSGAEKADSLFLWIVVNPEAEMPSERVVSPRGPLRKGLPVDFRNGYLCDISKKSIVKLALKEDFSGIEIKRIEVIAFSKNGEIFLRKLFTERRHV